MKSPKQKRLLKFSLMTSDQLDSVDRLYEHDRTLVIGKMGAGKTVITLTAIAQLLEEGVLSRVLIIGTKKVCAAVWPIEAGKWEHLKNLTVSVAMGTSAQRLKALQTGDVVCINFDNLPWLFKTIGKEHNFNGLVIDETSRLKKAGGSQFKALRRNLKRFTWRVGLTGTPVSEDFEGLYGQALLLDDGASLGTRFDKFQMAYFYATDWMQLNWALKTGAAAAISALIAPLVYTLPDYRHTLPDILYTTIKVKIPKSARAVYNEMAKHMIVTHQDDTIVAKNNAVLVQKLQQIAQGFLYDETGELAYPLHNAKLDALTRALTRMSGTCLIAYWYQEDCNRIVETFPDAVVLADHDTTATIARWNAGEISKLLIHPRSAGHGLNMAEGGHDIIWYGPQWSRDLWEQLNARIWRTGQKRKVRVQTILAVDTVDSLIVGRVADKGSFDRALHKHLAELKRA